MKDYLLDLIQHTYDLGCIDTIKIEGTEKETTVVGISINKEVVITGKFLKPVPEFAGVFGMPALSVLKTILNIDEYEKDAKIDINIDDKKGPVSMTFVNANGDFTNDYRFMVGSVVSEKIKTPKLKKKLSWDVEFEPATAALQRLKYQKMAMPDQHLFQTKVENNNLIFYFGDHSTHAGNFVFQSNVGGSWHEDFCWPIDHVINILGLTGDKVMQISSDRSLPAMQIVVNSGLAEYTYLLPSQIK